MRERDALHIIKKYPNRRLYDTQTSTYITLVDVKRMVLEKDEFRVVRLVPAGARCGQARHGGAGA